MSILLISILASGGFIGLVALRVVRQKMRAKQDAEERQAINASMTGVNEALAKIRNAARARPAEVSIGKGPQFAGGGSGNSTQGGKGGIAINTGPRQSSIPVTTPTVSTFDQPGYSTTAFDNIVSVPAAQSYSESSRCDSSDSSSSDSSSCSDSSSSSSSSD